MASLNTSELQFAFTFFAKFSALHNNNFNRFIIPSTILEGKDNYDYNGTDLVLDDYFIQFKMSSVLTRSYANEAHELNTPYFRFEVKNEPTRLSRSGMGQLDFLIRHANNPVEVNKVYYVTPSFDMKRFARKSGRQFWASNFYHSAPANIDDFCACIDIGSIDPSWVNSDNEHVICYEHSSDGAYFFSEPKRINKIKSIVSANSISGAYSKQHTTINNRISQIQKSFSDEAAGESISIRENSLASIQGYLLENFNIFWIPLISRRNN